MTNLAPGCLSLNLFCDSTFKDEISELRLYFPSQNVASNVYFVKTIGFEKSRFLNQRHKKKQVKAGFGKMRLSLPEKKFSKEKFSGDECELREWMQRRSVKCGSHSNLHDHNRKDENAMSKIRRNTNQNTKEYE